MDKRIFAPLIVIVVLVGAYAYWQHPKDVDDCILKHMSGTTNKEAARLIYASCDEKYSSRSAVGRKSRNLNPWEVVGITGRAGLSVGNYFAGSLYNGNDKVTVSRVEVVVSTSIDKQPSTRTYVADVTIPPKTTKDFGFNIIVGDPRAEYTWHLASAQGYEE